MDFTSNSYSLLQIFLADEWMTNFN